MIRERIQAFVKKLVKSVLIKRCTYDSWYRTFLMKRANNEIQIPKVDLQQKHISNLKVLLNRESLLNVLPKNAICAEIGVSEGAFSAMILKQTLPLKLHLIDAWGDATRYHNGLKELVKEKFRNEIEEDVVKLNVGHSTIVIKEFPDFYFDWVYLDTGHTYKLTSEELSILKEKVKPNGIIAGHDYILGNWGGDVRYGVIEAVHELCLIDNWELIYITANLNEMPSFAIRKISAEQNE